MSSELAVTPVPVRKFVEMYPTDDIDPRCRQWMEWVNEHNELCALLKAKKVANSSKGQTSPDQDIAVAQLRKAADVLSVNKLRKGVAEKYITGKTISAELHEYGTFENGEPFSNKWRSSESIRGYLKGPHHPKSRKRFMLAKKEKKSSFNR